MASGSLRPAPPGRLFFGVISGFPELFEQARDRIQARFGEIDPGGESPVFPFPATKAYGKTMGEALSRRFFILRRPWPLDGLAQVKAAAIAMEAEISGTRTFPVPRPINLDPGLLDGLRVVLATTKDRAHRIYRGGGLWEEVTLVFEHGEFRPLPWTYPDFRSPAYAAWFAAARDRHLEWLRDEAGEPQAGAGR
jgi:hypothetical protein